MRKKVYGSATLQIDTGTAFQTGRIFNPLGGGSGSITKTGDGILVLGDSLNQYTVGTVLQGGRFSSFSISSLAVIWPLGDGTLFLTGADSFDGCIALQADTLQLSSTEALGSTGTINLAGGVLRYTAVNATDSTERHYFTSTFQVYESRGSGTHHEGRCVIKNVSIPTK